MAKYLALYASIVKEIAGNNNAGILKFNSMNLNLLQGHWLQPLPSHDDGFLHLL